MDELRPRSGGSRPPRRCVSPRHLAGCPRPARAVPLMECERESSREEQNGRGPLSSAGRPDAAPLALREGPERSRVTETTTWSSRWKVSRCRPRLLRRSARARAPAHRILAVQPARAAQDARRHPSSPLGKDASRARSSLAPFALTRALLDHARSRRGTRRGTRFHPRRSPNEAQGLPQPRLLAQALSESRCGEEHSCRAGMKELRREDAIDVVMLLVRPRTLWT